MNVLFPDVDCLKSTSGMEYLGTRSVTKSGKSCLPWHKLSQVQQLNILHFPDEDLKSARAFCRNPDGLENSPWCYVDDLGAKDWCDIPRCCMSSHFLSLNLLEK